MGNFVVSSDGHTYEPNYNDCKNEKMIPTKPRKVLGIFEQIEYECPYCGETDGIKPIMNNCPWCKQLFKWE